jgi:hypothetical protein
MMIRSLALAILALFLPTVCSAEGYELSVLAGTMQDTDTGKPSYAWQLEFRKWIHERFAVSLNYLNEGHVPSHHRDGGAVQAWTRSELFVSRLFLSGGIGPYYYFDSTQPTSGAGYANEHGWGILGSLALAWHGESRLIYELRANFVETDFMDTRTLLFGIGYQWGALPEPTGPARSPANDPPKKNELTFFAGRTIVNSYESEHALALGVEYRRRLGQFIEGTIGLLDEGSTGTIDRTGAMAELWLFREILNGRISLGAGGGGYYARDTAHQHGQGGADHFLSGVVSLTAGCRIASDWTVRTSWSRMHTHYDRDTDVILLGMGYLF